MTRSRLTTTLLVLIVCLPLPLNAYIERLYAFKDILKESTNVVIGKIEKVDPKRRLAIATISRSLKGKQEFRRVRMNIGAGPASHAKYLFDRWRPGTPLVLFYNRDGRKIASCGHAGDTWFQLFADDRGKRDDIWWRFTHLEVYLGRTYNGTTSDLVKLTEGVIAGKVKPPKLNPKVPKLDPRNPVRRPPATGVARATNVAKGKVVLARGSSWRYVKGTREASSDSSRSEWRGRGFKDASWGTGKAPFGYGDGPFGTTLGDMRRTASKRGYTSLYLRSQFDVDDPSTLTRLTVSADYDDGFVLWLNGKEALAVNKPTRFVHDGVASGDHESGAYELFNVAKPASYLARGTNVVAVQVFNISPTSSDLKFDAEIRAEGGVRRGHGFFRQLTFARPRDAEPRGLSWIDINGDETLDLLACRMGGNLLLLGDGAGSFEDGTARYGVGKGSRVASWADYNGDDHPDVLFHDFRLLTSAGGGMRNDSRLLRAPSGRNPEGAGWIDHDGDGLPDILVTNGEHGIRLYRNSGKGPEWFQDVTDKAGLSTTGKGNGDFVAFTDYDGDGYTDVFYNLGKGLLLHNEGDGTFAVDGEAGIELPGGGASEKRGVAFADFDNDGDIDAFVPGPRKDRLYRNNNDGTFTDVIATSGALGSRAEASFAAAWGDVDHDGRLDVLVCHPGGPARLYLQTALGVFRDADHHGIDRVRGAYSASLADVDGDGDLDVALNTDRSVVVAFNDVTKRPGSVSILVRVRARRGLVGAVVRLVDGRGRPFGLRELTGAEGCGGQAWTTAHFGVEKGAYRISVALTDGRVAQRDVTVAKQGTTVVVREGDFK